MEATIYEGIGSVRRCLAWHSPFTLAGLCPRWLPSHLLEQGTPTLESNVPSPFSFTNYSPLGTSRQIFLYPTLFPHYMNMNMGHLVLSKAPQECFRYLINVKIYSRSPRSIPDALWRPLVANSLSVISRMLKPLAIWQIKISINCLLSNITLKSLYRHLWK